MDAKGVVKCRVK